MFGKNKKMSMRGMIKKNTKRGTNKENIVMQKRPTLKIGDRGENVEHLQRMLNDLSEVHPSVLMLVVDGIFGDNTKSSVEEFQKVAGLSANGIVDVETWNRLHFFHSNREMLRNRQSGIKVEDHLDQSNNVLKEGSNGKYVMDLQRYLNMISNKYSSINKLVVDGAFGPKTKAVVLEFQRIARLDQDGIVGQDTWKKLYNYAMNK